MVILHNPVHPGEVLQKEFIVELGLSAEALAKAIRVPPARIGDLVRQETDMATRLSNYFGTTSAFWLNLQRNYGLGFMAD